MSRPHVFLRIAVVVLISWISGSGSQIGLLYLGLPVLAAVLIAQKGGDRYLTEDGERVTRWLSFIVGFLAYLALLSDKLPEFKAPTVRLDITCSGSPNVGSALLRILKAIPSALALMIIGIVGWIVWIVAAVSILITERYPESLWNFQRGMVRWEARLLGYVASLTEVYPPFSFDTGPAESVSHQ